MRKTMNGTMLAAMMVALAGTEAFQPFARPSMLHPKAPEPLGDIERGRIARAEAKRARKAQIKRNGGKK